MDAAKHVNTLDAAHRHVRKIIRPVDARGRHIRIACIHPFGSAGFVRSCQPPGGCARERHVGAGGSDQPLLPDSAVDPLAQEIGVPAVPRVLLDHVHEHLAQLDRLAIGVSTRDLEIACLLHEPVSERDFAPPRRPRLRDNLRIRNSTGPICFAVAIRPVQPRRVHPRHHVAEPIPFHVSEMTNQTSASVRQVLAQRGAFISQVIVALAGIFAWVDPHVGIESRGTPPGASRSSGVIAASPHV